MRTRSLLIIGGITLYAIVVRLFFGVRDLQGFFAVLSLSFLFCLPAIIGLLTVYFFGDDHKIQDWIYCFFIPWAPIGFFMLLTLLTGLEGWACWLIILIPMLITASLGGLLGGYLKTRQHNRTHVLTLLLLPFLVSPIESQFATPAKTYRAYTCIDINAPADVIWRNVTRVRAIPEAQDTGWLTRFLGFPRPVEALLNYEGVGAYREARFTNGLVFHETVTDYIDKRKMVFSIKAYPHEIPAATLDEHIVIGGRYFDVLTGTYELEKRGPTTYRLHLYSQFVLHTRINAYASWWATQIMQDIQNNILQVEKLRSETNS